MEAGPSQALTTTAKEPAGGFSHPVAGAYKGRDETRRRPQ
jgi:hypothetical protein